MPPDSPWHTSPALILISKHNQQVPFAGYRGHTTVGFISNVRWSLSDKTTKTKAELHEMLAAAVRNTQPQPVPNAQPAPVRKTPPAPKLTAKTKNVGASGRGK
jgi:hypothetical protein